MNLISVACIEEPVGSAYKELIKLCSDYCDRFLLVRRSSVGLSPHGLKLLEQLHPELIAENLSRTWPGTILLGEKAQVLFFRVSESSLQVLEGADSLFAWTQPDLPEDLCFLRSDGTAFMTTIAHERDCYLELSKEELQDALTRPAVSAILRVETAE